MKNNTKILIANLFLLFSVCFGSYLLIFGAEPDWINYDERVVGENSPAGYTDVVNRPTKELYALFTSQHSDEGVHKLSTISANLDTVDSPTSWRVFYSDGSSILTELALGASGLCLKSQGASAAPVFGACVATESDPLALLTAGTDNVKDTHIDWGSGAGQVDADDVGDGSTNAIVTLTQETNFETAYSHSQDNTQAHSDYFLNTGADTAGTGAGFAWTFDAGATDPTVTFGSDSVAWTNAATFTVGGVQVGDVLSAGDCTAGACFDGTSDSGTYIRLYDGDSHYLEINPGDLTADRILATRDAAGTFLISGDTLTGDITATFDTDGSTATAIGSSVIVAGDFADNDWGDLSVATNVVSIDADAVTEADLKAVDSASDEDILTYETTTGDFEWHSSADLGIGVATSITDGLIIEPDLDADNSPSDGDILTYDLTGTNFAWITQNAGTDITADLEEESHASEHAVSAADTVFPADPNADRYLKWNDTGGALEWAEVAGGVGDVESVGDCLSGACYDGTSDGGTYARLYDGDSDYVALTPGNLTATRTLTVRDASGTIILSGDTFSGDVTGTLGAGGSTALTIATGAVGTDELASTAVTPGSYTVASITVDEDGRLTAASSGSASGSSYVKISDTKAAGTDGGTCTSGSYQTRDLNTEDSDADGVASISSNQITLAAGTYITSIRAPGVNLGPHKAILYNVSDSAVTLIGEVTYADGMSTISGQFTIAGAKVFEVRHRCTTTRAITGFGDAANWGDSEVYTVAEFWKTN